MIKVLFICHGNICRSPMAEYIFKDMIKKNGIEDRFSCDSAATSREELGNPIYPLARRKLQEKGVPYGNHRAVQLTSADYDKYDYLIVMDEINRGNLMRIIGSDPDGKVHSLLSFAGDASPIADPWYTEDFEKAYNEIVRGLTAFLKKFSE